MTHAQKWTSPEDSVSVWKVNGRYFSVNLLQLKAWHSETEIKRKNFNCMNTLISTHLTHKDQRYQCRSMQRSRTHALRLVNQLEPFKTLFFFNYSYWSANE